MFKIGDTVLVKRDYMGAKITGLHAEVIGLESVHGVSLEFDVLVPGIKDYERHCCGDKGEYGYCWNVPPSYLILVEKDHRSPIERKCRKLWNQSKWVKTTPTLSY